MSQIQHPYSESPRLPHIPRSLGEAVQYFATRARQMLSFGYVWTEAIETHEFGYVTYFNYEGKTVAGITQNSTSAVTCYEAMNFVEDSDTKYFIDFGGQIGQAGIGKKFYTMPGYEHVAQYKAVTKFYGNDRAERSGVLKMNHIDEAITIIKRASDLMTEYQSDTDVGHAITSFCLHPMFQADADLLKISDERVFLGDVCDPIDLVYVMEYRSVANEYLSHRTVDDFSNIRLSPIKEVNLMLIGDKVQNYKDFVTYHQATHPRARELSFYFQNWLDRLGVNAGLYHKLIKHIPSV